MVPLPKSDCAISIFDWFGGWWNELFQFYVLRFFPLSKRIFEGFELVLRSSFLSLSLYLSLCVSLSLSLSSWMTSVDSVCRELSENIGGGHISFQKDRTEWFIRYFGHGDNQPTKQSVDPRACLLVSIDQADFCNTNTNTKQNPCLPHQYQRPFLGAPRSKSNHTLGRC